MAMEKSNCVGWSSFREPVATCDHARKLKLTEAQGVGSTCVTLKGSDSVPNDREINQRVAFDFALMHQGQPKTPKADRCRPSVTD